MVLLPYTRVAVKGIPSFARGVYGIRNYLGWVYVGQGWIHDRLMSHLNGDNLCITFARPIQFFYEVVWGDPSRREKELILRLNPTCNRRVG